MMAADVEPGAEMIRRGDWGERRDWFEFAVGAPHCDALVATVGDEVVGTGVGTRHGPVGWVGTIFVSSEHRRQGIGQALSAAVCERLEAAGCRSLVLVATDLGRPVYERLGFEETAWYRIFERHGTDRSTGTGDPLVRPFATEDLPAAIELDRAATGEDRRLTLTVAGEEPGGLAVVSPSGELRGFALRAPWGGVATIAPEADDAMRLLHERLRAAGPGHLLRTGLVETNHDGRARLEADGWRDARRVVRMGRGEPVRWSPRSIWGQWGMAVG
jgi:GNAT superfamily N-acetyltransferase